MDERSIAHSVSLEPREGRMTGLLEKLQREMSSMMFPLKMSLWAILAVVWSHATVWTSCCVMCSMRVGGSAGGGAVFCEREFSVPQTGTGRMSALISWTRLKPWIAFVASQYDPGPAAGRSKSIRTGKCRSTQLPVIRLWIRWRIRIS